MVRKDEVSWGRYFSSRRAASFVGSSQRELLHGVLDGGVGGRHGSPGPVCVSANARWAGRRGSETARGSRATALRTPLRSIARQARRSAASSGHLLWSRPKVSRALPTERPYVIAAAISHPYGISHARYRLYDIIQRSYASTLAVIPRDIMLISTTSYTPPHLRCGYGGRW